MSSPPRHPAGGAKMRKNATLSSSADEDAKSKPSSSNSQQQEQLVATTSATRTTPPATTKTSPSPPPVLGTSPTLTKRIRNWLKPLLQRLDSGQLATLGVLGVAFVLALIFIFVAGPLPLHPANKYRTPPWKWYRFEKCKLVDSGRKADRNDGDSFYVECPKQHVIPIGDEPSTSSGEPSSAAASTSPGTTTGPNKDTAANSKGKKMGLKTELRLYYVDAPESKYKVYRHASQNNGKRLQDQANYFAISKPFDPSLENSRADRFLKAEDEGRVSAYHVGDEKIPAVSVIGRWAKSYTRARLKILAENSFIVWTMKELVYGDPDRMYGLVEFKPEIGSLKETLISPFLRESDRNSVAKLGPEIHRFLHRELVTNGFVRLRQTKGPGVEFPFPGEIDVSEEQFLALLEEQAKESKYGGWNTGFEHGVGTRRARSGKEDGGSWWSGGGISSSR
ncbi:unnamed protein product [Amoebophrya sp. A120]|nr:unnamed protein product [Amoebophrya sp. A120]|eukprot:GSA120T00009489001.1